MKILVIGELNIDLILDDFNAFPSVGKEVLAQSMNLTLGSSSAIFASNLSNLGNQISFMGLTGNDHFGDSIIQIFKSHNVDTSHIIQSDRYSTGLTVILNADEDRANVTFPGAMAHFSEGMIDFEFFENFDHLHLSSYFLQPSLAPSIPRIFQIAKELGLSTSFDMQWDPHETWDIPLSDILPFVNIFLPNENELLAITHRTSLNAALDKLESYANVIAVKQGSQGSVVFSEGQQNHMNSFLNTRVVDAIGAGDSFNAGFIHQYIRRQPLLKCQEYANLTGAISTTGSGGTKALENKTHREIVSRTLFNKVM